MTNLGTTDLDVSSLCLGGNVFGWSAGEQDSFDVLDAFAASGGNFIDTADVYSAWIAGNSGGESEAIIGRWMASRGNRDRVIVATKVAKKPDRAGLSAANIRAAVEESLARLGTDYIDLYYAHEDDQTVPLAESLGAFDALVREGKVRYVGASQYSAPRLAEALDVSVQEGLVAYSALQTQYNLMERAAFEPDLAEVCERNSLPCLPYYGLARGFLTGKYRPGAEVDSVRAGGVAAYRTERGYAVLAVLDDIAAAHRVPVAAVSLAWLAAQPAVAAPIASARTVEQLSDLLPMNGLELGSEELAALDKASGVAA
jgi:aryl-alcohol dehydrogenase-like predicted oxidoreductase